MKVLAVNGGPRKTWNTATLLEKALEGWTDTRPVRADLGV